MKITFDSNAWEKIFNPGNGCSATIAVLNAKLIQGFICWTSFRIEAIRKSNRAAYFQQPHMDFDVGAKIVEGRPWLTFSLGPDDSRHPGPPAKQREKLDRAFEAGVQLIHGGNWLGLPCPREISDPARFVGESELERAAREQRECDASWLIEQRGVGKAAFDDAEGGREKRVRDAAAEQRLSRACAEWADGETVSAHISYQHDFLCTDDRGRSAGISLFDEGNPRWLSETFGLRFMSTEELAAAVK
jgi:hypothetical protein